jgi:hypothetical protein
MIKNFLDDIYIIENISSKEFYKIKEDYKILTPDDIFYPDIIKELKKNRIKHIFCSIGIININDIKKNYENKIIGIYNKNLKTNVLFKKEKQYNKKYNQISDIIDDHDIGIYVNHSEEAVEITGYNLSTLEIMFFGKISNWDDEEYYFKEDFSFVESTASIKDINAKNILYPLLGYYAKKNTIMCDRDIISYKAKSVWFQYFKDGDIFKRYLPLDDLKITSNENYGSIIYHKISNNNKKKFYKKYQKNIINKNDDYRKKILIHLKKDHYLDWSFKLNDDLKKELNEPLNTLRNRHIKNHKIEKKLNDLSNKFFHNMISI